LSQASSGATADSLLDVLLDTERPADGQLPKSGLGIEVDRQLSPIFVATPTFGTRTSTFLAIDKAGKPILTERTFTPGTQQYSVHTVRP
jgi:uncharacterized protein with NRDE domain